MGFKPRSVSVALKLEHRLLTINVAAGNSCPANTGSFSDVCPERRWGESQPSMNTVGMQSFNIIKIHATIGRKLALRSKKMLMFLCNYVKFFRGSITRTPRFIVSSAFQMRKTKTQPMKYFCVRHWATYIVTRQFERYLVVNVSISYNRYKNIMVSILLNFTY